MAKRERSFVSNSVRRLFVFTLLMKFRVCRSSENRAISYCIAAPRYSVLFLVGDLRPACKRMLADGLLISGGRRLLRREFSYSNLPSKKRAEVAHENKKSQPAPRSFAASESVTTRFAACKLVVNCHYRRIWLFYASQLRNGFHKLLHTLKRL